MKQNKPRKQSIPHIFLHFLPYKTKLKTFIVIPFGKCSTITKLFQFAEQPIRLHLEKGKSATHTQTRPHMSYIIGESRINVSHTASLVFKQKEKREEKLAAGSNEFLSRHSPHDIKKKGFIFYILFSFYIFFTLFIPGPTLIHLKDATCANSSIRVFLVHNSSNLRGIASYVRMYTMLCLLYSSLSGSRETVLVFHQVFTRSPTDTNPR